MANKNQAKIAITDQERCFATLTASGLWSQADAHRMSFPDSKLKDDSQRRQLGSVMSQKAQVRAYKQTALLSWVSEKDKAVAVGINTSPSDFATGENGQMTKDDIRRLMTSNILRETDPVKQSKLAESLAVLDGQRGNSDTGTTDDKVQFFTPYRCIDNCHLYKQELERIEAEKERVGRK